MSSNALFPPTILDWDGLAPYVSSPGEILDVNPGEKASFRIPVARRASGENLAITVHVARGLTPGPVLSLIAAVHGDAIYGSLTVMESFTRIDTSTLSGTVIAVAVANPLAFESHTRATGQGMNTDMNNMNRVFPGNAGGWVTQKLAAALAEYVLDQSDAVIDYHCGGDTSIDYTLVSGNSTEAERRVYDYTRLMATPFIFVHDKDPFSGTIDEHVRSRGKLCIVAEQGGNIMQPGFLELALQRVDNFLAGLGMIEKVPVLPEKQLVMTERFLVRMDHGGLFVPAKGIEILSELVDGGELLGTIVDPHSYEVLQEIRAPYEKSAILMSRPGLSRVNPGDYGYIIARGDTGEWIDAPSNWRIAV
jgi:predicted deacylase